MEALNSRTHSSIIRVTAEKTPGFTSGKRILRMVPTALHPEILDASSSSGWICVMEEDTAFHP